MGASFGASFGPVSVGANLGPNGVSAGISVGGFGVGFGAGAPGSAGNSGALFPVQIGQFVAWGMSIPEKLNFGGAQRVGVHQLPNGIRVVDVMGADDDDIQWSGQFITRGPGDPAPLEAARYLDYVRKNGATVTLSYESFQYTVIIEHFKCEFEYVTVLPFSMTCKIIEDMSAPSGPGGSPDVDDLVSGDWGNSLGIMPGLGLAVPIGLPGPFSMTIGAVSAASNAIQFLGQGFGQTISAIGGLNLPDFPMSLPGGLPVPLFNTLTEASQFLQGSPAAYAADYVATQVLSGPSPGLNPDGSVMPFFASSGQALSWLAKQLPGFSAQYTQGT